jgi:transposase
MKLTTEIKDKIIEWLRKDNKTIPEIKDLLETEYNIKYNRSTLYRAIKKLEVENDKLAVHDVGRMKIVDLKKTKRKKVDLDDIIDVQPEIIEKKNKKPQKTYELAVYDDGSKKLLFQRILQMIHGFLDELEYAENEKIRLQFTAQFLTKNMLPFLEAYDKHFSKEAKQEQMKEVFKEILQTKNGFEDPEIKQIIQDALSEVQKGAK